MSVWFSRIPDIIHWKEVSGLLDSQHEVYSIPELFQLEIHWTRKNIGAGVQAFEAYTTAGSHGLRIEGGHSLLSSMHGMGADLILEWEAVTANGTHLIASPTENKDLYWAFSGGGGGTYGHFGDCESFQG
ncbi:hypothetical protein QQS21_005636 [Conoideocrella luteorostrata]|uniref:Uncharacterized protein n=1 Tax=Conoideocrella luteorostrata TaxID=1105319 RepID=A0AAJ0FU91_9HYPO|nr:hypothetical protein QQS21_005636 [Conoideocrella luteorostrata]